MFIFCFICVVSVLNADSSVARLSLPGDGFVEWKNDSEKLAPGRWTLACCEILEKAQADGLVLYAGCEGDKLSPKIAKI